MKKFDFPLERVRHYRSLQLEAEKARLDDCAVRIQRIDEAAAALTAERSAAAESLRTGGDAALYGAYGPYSGHVEQSRRRLAALRAQAVAEFERQKSNVTVARQRLEMLEKYRARALEEWKSELAREEENLAGELFLAAAARELRRNGRRR